MGGLTRYAQVYKKVRQAVCRVCGCTFEKRGPGPMPHKCWAYCGQREPVVTAVRSVATLPLWERPYDYDACIVLLGAVVKDGLKNDRMWVQQHLDGFLQRYGFDLEDYHDGAKRASGG